MDRYAIPNKASSSRLVPPHWDPLLSCEAQLHDEELVTAKHEARLREKSMLHQAVRNAEVELMHEKRRLERERNAIRFERNVLQSQVRYYSFDDFSKLMNVIVLRVAYETR